MDFFQRLKLYFAVKTDAELADKLGMSLPTLQKAKVRKSYFSVAEDAFEMTNGDISIDYLLHGYHSSSVAKNIKIPNAQFINILNAISDAEKCSAGQQLFKEIEHLAMKYRIRQWLYKLQLIQNEILFWDMFFDVIQKTNTQELRESILWIKKEDNIEYTLCVNLLDLEIEQTAKKTMLDFLDYSLSAAYKELNLDYLLLPLIYFVETLEERDCYIIILDIKRVLNNNNLNCFWNFDPDIPF